MKKNLEKNAASRKETFNQIDKAMIEFSKEKTNSNDNKERIEVSLDI